MPGCIHTYVYFSVNDDVDIDVIIYIIFRFPKKNIYYIILYYIILYYITLYYIILYYIILYYIILYCIYIL